MNRLRAALAPVALLAAACGPIPGPDSGADPLAALGPARAEWLDLGKDAAIALRSGRWAEAAALYERRIALVPPPGEGEDAWGRPLGAALRGDLYNLACCRSRAGRRLAALDALEQAVGRGFGTIGWQHLLEDPDLDAIRDDPRWAALVDRLCRAGDAAILPPSGADGGRAPGVVVLLGLRGTEGLRPMSDAVIAAPAPPYLVAPGKRDWTAGLDRGERAAEAAVRALEEAAAPGPTDAARHVILARGDAAVRLAWEVLLRRPDAFTRAVLDGPLPPLVDLLDRGAEGIRAEILVAGEEGMPPPWFPARARVLPSGAAALAEALR